MDEYRISDIPERFLMTQHYQSSMQQPNLQNVQAKLHVARQRNHQLAMQYFRNKYGTAAAYEDFAKKHNMGEIVQQPTPQQILVRHLQMKARQIQRKVHNQQSFEQQKEQYSVNVKQPQWARKHAKKAANNPWTKQQKSPQKHKRNETESSKYIDSAIAPKNKETEFISQFKNYLQQKQKMKQLQKNMSQIPAGDQSMNKTTESKMFTASKVHNKSILENSQSNGGGGAHGGAHGGGDKKKCYEEELAKKIFKDLGAESKDQSAVEKLALVQYVVKNKKILKVLGISQTGITKQIMKDYQTKSQNQITLQEFTFFILKSVGKQKQINAIKQQKRPKDIPQGCMLQKQMIIHFQKVFKQLDTHTDLLIKRLPYIDRLANDPLIKNQLNIPAVFQPEINRPVSLRRIFQRIQMECLFGNQNQQKVKEYISWNQFLGYFQAGVGDQATYDIVTLVESLHKSDSMGLVEVPDIAIQIIIQILPKLSSKNGYFSTLSLIQAILKHPEYQHEKYTQVRQESRIAGLPSQTFEEVLARIKKNADKFMTLKQFLEYFSSKGRPLELFQEARLNSARKNFSGVKVKFAGDQLKNQKDKQNLDGYDSDPQIYQSKIMNKNSPRKSGRSQKKLQHATSFIEQVKSKPTSRRQYKVTVPMPFSFEERQKQRSKQKAQRKADDEQKFKQFKAIPIPEKVLEEGLYEKMLEEDKLKIQERRKSCMIMTLANQRPFSFLNRKTNKKTKQQRQQFVFKAKPIPWYCSVDLLQKKKEAQIVRNEKIAKQAQQNLAKAKLPPRMQRDFQQKQAKAATQQQKFQRPQSQPKLYKDPPNFDKLHRQFEQGLQRRRKQNKTTKPQQFNFNQKSSKVVLGPSQSQQQFFKDHQNKQKPDYKKIFQNKPAAPSTVKFQKLVEKRREQMDRKKKEEEKKKKEDQKWQKIDEDLKNKLLAATKNKQNKEEEQRLKRQEEMKEQMKTFQQWKKKCIQKGRNQPMLVERPLKRDQKIQKMKKLYQISQTLKGNGIKGKDHDSYFKRQELLMLQDYEVLKTTLNQP